MSGGARGFTLVELLVVLLIIGLLLVAGPFTFERARAGLAVHSDAREVAAILREARSRAISGNQETAVVVDLARRQIALESGKLSFAFSEGVTITFQTAASEQIGPDAARIRFFPSGASTGGRLVLDRRGNSYRVEVDWLFGRVRVVE
jgi:general secretion pathway protein H